jgi:MFS family permease
MPAEAPTRVRFAVLGWLCAGAMLAYLHRFCISVPYEAIRNDLSLTPWQMDLVLGSFFAGYSLLQIPSGWLGDRFGSRRALALFAAVWSVATAFMGLADGFLVALAAWVVNGIGQAGIFPCCVKSISHWFPASGRAFPNGMLTSFMAIGSIAAGALIGELLVYFSCPMTESIATKGLIQFALPLPSRFAKRLPVFTEVDLWHHQTARGRMTIHPLALVAAVFWLNRCHVQRGSQPGRERVCRCP